MSGNRREKVEQITERIKALKADLNAAEEALEDVVAEWDVIEDGTRLFLGGQDGYTCVVEVANKGTRLSFFQDDQYEGIGPEQARQLSEQLIHWADTGKFKQVNS